MDIGAILAARQGWAADIPHQLLKQLQWRSYSDAFGMEIFPVQSDHISLASGTIWDPGRITRTSSSALD